MSNESQNSIRLCKEIPSFLRTPQQVPHWEHGKRTPTYVLLRDPISLQELNQYPCSLAIWRDNGTLTYVTPSNSQDLPHRSIRCLFLEFSNSDKDEPALILSITGISDEAIVDTLDYFVSMQEQDATAEISRHIAENGPPLGTDLVLGTYENEVFDIRRSKCLPTSPTLVEFENVVLSAEQTTVLATIPCPTTTLAFDGCLFEDLGTAFVNALEDRKSSFWMLQFVENTPLSDNNLKRLLQVDKFKWLLLPRLSDELVFLPFSTKAGALDYWISSSALSEAASLSLKIVPSELTLHISHENESFPTEEVLSFFRHAADLRHFTALGFEFPFLNSNLALPKRLLQGLIEVALANPALERLGLYGFGGDLPLGNVVETLFEGIKDHRNLRFVRLDVADDAFGPDFALLRELISYNRNIIVTDIYGKTYSNGIIVDELYSLNRFYRGSADLMTNPERQSLLAAALVERASKDFQRTALLLSSYTNELRDWVQFADLVDLDEHDPSETAPSL